MSTIDTQPCTLTLHDVFGPDGYIAINKPGYEVRQPQIEVAELTARAIAEQRNALIEAGTGTGKSFALVTPAVLSGKRVVVSTETNTLLDQYINIDLPFLQRILPKPFRFAKAKGRGNYVCRKRLDEYVGQPLLSAWADDGEVDQLVAWAADTYSGDRSEPTFRFSDASWQTIGADELCSKRGCRYYGEGPKGDTSCFACKARRDFLQADIVVTNHTLCLLNAQIGGDAVLGEHQVCIFDEAHTLAEQAQKTFGYEIKQKTLSNWTKYAARLCKQSDLVLDGYNATDIEPDEKLFFEQFRRLTKQQTCFEDIPDLIRGEMRKASEKLLRWLDLLRSALNSVMPGTDEDRQLLDELDSRTREHMKSLRGLFDPEANWLPFAEVTQDAHLDDRRVSLHYKPVDVAPLLRRDVYDWRQSTILASATLAIAGSMDFIQRDLGIEDPLCMQVESPFDYVEQCSAYFPTHMPDPSMPDYHTAMADEVTNILTHTNGRAFVLFTSVRDLNRVYDLVSPRLRFNMLKQGDFTKPETIKQFKADVHSVLFATRSFFTGVDIPGEALSCVILSKVPFRPPDEPLFRAKCGLIKARGGSDFREYALPLAVNDTRQAFGRLIRSKLDTGLFCLLDSRAINKPYFSVIARSLPNMRVSRTL